MHTSLISDMNIEWRQVVLDSISFCDIISKKVWALARDINLAVGGSNSTKESKGTSAFFAEKVKADFYNRIDGPFRRWLCTLNPETGNAGEKEVQWRSECVCIAKQLGNEIIRQADTAAIFGRLKSISEDKKKNEAFSAASAMNRFLIGLSVAENS